MEAGRAILEGAYAKACTAGHPEKAARALNNLGAFGVYGPEPALAERLPQALEFCLANNQDLWRINVLAVATRNALDRGRWTEAGDLARTLLEDPRESPWPHHEALLVLALVRARRGDPGATEALEQATAVGVPPDEVGAHLDVAAAHAEVAWLEQRLEEVDEVTRDPLDAAVARGDRSGAERLAFWRRIAGLPAAVVEPTGGPFGLAVAGRWQAAAAEWERKQLPYEASLALIEAGDETSLRRGLESLRELGRFRLAARHASPARARGTGHRQGAAEDDARERRRPDRPRARSRPSGRRGAPERGYRTPAVSLPTHRRPPRLLAPAQARGRLAGRGGRRGVTARPARRPVALSRKLGSSTDVPARRAA